MVFENIFIALKVNKEILKKNNRKLTHRKESYAKYQHFKAQFQWCGRDLPDRHTTALTDHLN